MLRRRRDRRATPAPGPGAAQALSGEWRTAVEEAAAARARFTQLVAGVAPGPLRDRLDAIGTRLEGAVAQITDTAGRAHQIESTVAALGPTDVTDRLKDARRRLGSTPEGPEAERLTAAVDALSAQHASLNRMRNAVEEAERGLRLLDLRIDAAVAQAAELALLGDAGGLSPVEDELQAVVDELSALRAGLTEVGR